MIDESTQTGGSEGVAVAHSFDPEVLAYLNRMTSLGLVVPNAAHEVNNTLQIVGGLVELLAAKDLPQDVLDKLAKIQGQTGRAVELVQQMVSFIRRDGLPIAKSDMCRAVDGALALRRYHLSRSGVQVHVDADGEGPFVVSLDPHTLQQVLLNLIVNAEQALLGCDTRAIRVAIGREGNVVRLAVSDSGCGMSAEVASRAFDPFFTTRREHAGLGLTVVRVAVVQRGGHVRLESALGGGTTVRLAVPAS